MTTCSYFFGICFSTSCFNRRSRNGRSTCLAYNNSHHHCCRHHVASSGTRVTPPWPCRMACLQRLAGTDPVSLQSWSVQRVRGRPGRCLQSPPSERPDARPTWQCRPLCADRRRLLMNYITGGKPVRADTSVLVAC